MSGLFFRWALPLRALPLPRSCKGDEIILTVCFETPRLFYVQNFQLRMLKHSCSGDCS